MLLKPSMSSFYGRYVWIRLNVRSSNNESLPPRARCKAILNTSRPTVNWNCSFFSLCTIMDYVHILAKSGELMKRSARNLYLVNTFSSCESI